jgi:hypothetical protein
MWMATPPSELAMWAPSVGAHLGGWRGVPVTCLHVAISLLSIIKNLLLTLSIDLRRQEVFGGITRSMGFDNVLDNVS